MKLTLDQVEKRLSRDPDLAHGHREGSLSASDALAEVRRRDEAAMARLGVSLELLASMSAAAEAQVATLARVRDMLAGLVCQRCGQKNLHESLTPLADDAE